MSFLAPPKLTLITLLLLSVPGIGFADTLFLKDGTEVKGDIISRGADGVVIEYFVNSTIKDQKTYSNEEIVKIVATPEDEKAFLALGNLTPPTTALDTAFYDPLVDEKIPAFIKTYPYSSHVSDVRITLRSLTADRDRLKAGDRKIDGGWITAAEVAANPYEMQAKIQYGELKQRAAQDDPVATLKTYELLEQKYPGSSVIPDAIELARLQLERLQAKLNSVKADFDSLAKQRQTSLASLPPDQAKAIQTSLDNERLQSKALIAAAAKDGSKFFPIFPNVKEALDQLQALVTAEMARLKLFLVSDMRASLTDTADASRLIDGGNIKDAQSQLDASAKLWSSNAAIATIKQKVDAASKPPSKAH